jgi:hypothetical protein
MLIEDANGAQLFLFDEGLTRQDAEDPVIGTALEKTRSTDARTRVIGLVELAGVDDAVALDVALMLLSDPEPAVRDEARHLILDHPAGGALANALGLVDDELED